MHSARRRITVVHLTVSEAKERHAERDALAALFSRRAAEIHLPIDTLNDGAVVPDDNIGRIRTVATLTRDSLAGCWTQLQALGTLLDEYAEEFDGDDPLRPRFREFHDEAVRDAAETHGSLAYFIGPWDLPDDHSEAIAMCQRLAERVLA